jgi:hypothetical protein
MTWPIFFIFFITFAIVGVEVFPPPSHKAMLASVFHTAVLEVAVLVEKRML